MDASQQDSLFYTRFFGFFKYIGLSPHGRSSTKFVTLLLICWMIQSFCSQFAYVIENADSIENLIRDGTKLIQVLGLVMKLVIFWIKENEIRTLIGDINDMIRRKLHTSAIRHFRKLNNYINRCLNFYFCIGFFSFFATSIFNPFRLLVLNYQVQGTWDFSKSFPNYWFHDSPNMFALYAIYVWLAAWVVLAIIICDMMIFGLCVQSYAFYECLIDDFRSLDNILGTDGLAVHPLDEVNARRRMRKIINQHVEVIERLQKINDILEPLVMVEFLTGLLLITLYFYGAQTPSMKPIGFFLSCTYQLFIYCYGGSIIQTMSAKFSREIYNTHWYNYPLWAQKEFQMIVTMATRTRCLSAYAYKCDLETFRKIINFSYTIYAFLVQLKKN